jgi:hypothetical protein
MASPGKFRSATARLRPVGHQRLASKIIQATYDMVSPHATDEEDVGDVIGAQLAFQVWCCSAAVRNPEGLYGLSATTDMHTGVKAAA